LEILDELEKQANYGLENGLRGLYVGPVNPEMVLRLIAVARAAYRINDGDDTDEAFRNLDSSIEALEGDDKPKVFKHG